MRITRMSALQEVGHSPLTTDIHAQLTRLGLFFEGRGKHGSSEKQGETDMPPRWPAGSPDGAGKTPVAGKCKGHAEDHACDRPTSVWSRSTSLPDQCSEGEDEIKLKILQSREV